MRLEFGSQALAGGSHTLESGKRLWRELELVMTGNH